MNNIIKNLNNQNQNILNYNFIPKKMNPQQKIPNRIAQKQKNLSFNSANPPLTTKVSKDNIFHKNNEPVNQTIKSSDSFSTNNSQKLDENKKMMKIGPKISNEKIINKSNYTSNDQNYFGNANDAGEGINLNNNFLALTSNSILPDGADLLVFYDVKNRKILDFQRKINFSFNIGVNGLNLMKLKDGKNILLCACKKYISSQKNGILIIDPEMKGEEIYYKFYETEEFEVNCFCPLYIKEDNKRLNTNFFFVGGLDADQKSGLIKLFGVCKNSSEKIGYFIEFLQDITFEKTNEFNGSINCIIQLKTNGNILANCLDGNLFYISEPNITYYLEELR
jgi:hypothetical protein